MADTIPVQEPEVPLISPDEQPQAAPSTPESALINPLPVAPSILTEDELKSLTEDEEDNSRLHPIDALRREQRAKSVPYPGTVNQGGPAVVPNANPDHANIAMHRENQRKINEANDARISTRSE